MCLILNTSTIYCSAAADICGKISKNQIGWVVCVAAFFFFCNRNSKRAYKLPPRRIAETNLCVAILLSSEYCRCVFHFNIIRTQLPIVFFVVDKPYTYEKSVRSSRCFIYTHILHLYAPLRRVYN